MTLKVAKNVLLSDLTFYGIGGGADEVYEIDNVEDLAPIWSETISKGIPKVVIGKGSNVIFSDIGFRGRVFIPRFDAIIWDENEATVDVGKSFQDFIEASNNRGYSDLCKLSGIPGNVGGFIRGNAGAYGVEISNSCIVVDYLDERGNLKTLLSEQCEFGYRESVFKRNPDWCIVRGKFKFDHVEKTLGSSLQETKQILMERWKKNPSGRSGGCLFKNPLNQIAGKLLDECGAKGDRIGDVQISEKHANFFLNLGKAKQADVLALAWKWRDIILEKKGIVLELEVFVCDEVGGRVDL